MPEIDYRRKLYAFLRSTEPRMGQAAVDICAQLDCLKPQLGELAQWWQNSGHHAQAVSSSSDRVNLAAKPGPPIEIRHPISGQQQAIAEPSIPNIPIPGDIQRCEDADKVFWWFWRFYPEHCSKVNVQGLIYPAHSILPDCPLHSYQSAVSALSGAMSTGKQRETPYLLLFSFSPVQEFIKSSRKFLDFWAGSYLLHYLSTRLCWHVAQEYGPDSLIVPSLWGQDIIDAFLLQRYRLQTIEGKSNPNYSPEFAEILAREFDTTGDGREPVERFDNRISNSLSTAGLPNMITVLVPGKAAATALGNSLKEKLQDEWETIGNKVKGHVCSQVVHFLNSSNQKCVKAQQDMWAEFEKSLPKGAPPDVYRRELDLLKQNNCWEWRHLWREQLQNAWEPYWAAVPLCHPDQPPLIASESESELDQWAEAQGAIAWPPEPLPSPAEKAVYYGKQLNIGTWWGSLQQRLRTAHMAVKNTRHWQIPAAPGPRSTLSGQFSALHPRLNYQTLKRNGKQKDFREGGGLPESSMRLFWLLMSYAYPGLFNGSEMLNALELTKRMAWQFGGVAESMGIEITREEEA
ncbi:MAG: type III-B CRISPR-associated protein Cas10/Cmr2, partial [Elainellaceae cyanobacterium]